MKHYIDKSVLVAEIEKRKKHNKEWLNWCVENRTSIIAASQSIQEDKDIMSLIDTLEGKEVDLTDKKTDWCPSKKQMESLNDMLKYNIGVFDYQKFMEVKSLYDDLTKILDYETDRQR